ncbi:MAG: asparagine synthase (glutamine-hydrolyzing) [Hyphomonadaceae bacterium]|nr:asparagine synthase (glutamine-hydrolyzing) [Hyphomonadaceae bacterium]
MCGLIAGIGRGCADHSAITAGLKAIRHRGPDEDGILKTEAGHAFLAHARLSIIGLDNGTQPISSADNTVHIVVNGEFYGYQAIRDELRAEGVVFRTDSDSEVALHLYLTRGLQGIDRLNGEFAIVILDERKQEMIAIRDRFGIKPLFYTVHEGAVYFASEVKAFAGMGLPMAWDRQAAYMEAFWVRDHERTLFRNVYSVPQGHCVIARQGEVRAYPYWDWTFPPAGELAKDTRSDQEIVAQFREVLSGAISRRLVADVPVACYLSGGVDSCAVLGIAQGLLDRPIECYTLEFDDPLYNELQVAEQQAAKSGANFHPIRVSRQDLADAYAQAVWHAETPFVNSNSTGKYLLSKAVNQAGVKVVLTGEGADEMLAGYPTFKRDALLQHPGARSEQETEQLLEALYNSNRATRAIFMQKGQHDPFVKEAMARLGWAPSFMETYCQLGRIASGIYRDDLAEAAGGINPMGDALNRLPVSTSVLGRERLNQALYLNARTHLPNYILTVLADRMEMANSVEGRVPFLDHELAEFAAHLPLHMKVNGLTEKYVLREAARDVLTDDVYARQKHAFSAPPARGADDPMMVMYKDVLASKALEEQPVFDPERARNALSMLAMIPDDQKIAFEGLLHKIVSITVMHERFSMS